MTTTIPDDDDFSPLYILTFFAILLSIPLLIVLTITTCIATSRTREWQKSKLHSSHYPSETASLVRTTSTDSQNDSDLDPDDSGDEAELKLREEKRRDLTLTTRQYFWKQMGKTWKGDPSVANAIKAKERADRNKLAKALARELTRIERRKSGKSGLVEKQA